MYSYFLYMTKPVAKYLPLIGVILLCNAVQSQDVEMQKQPLRKIDVENRIVYKQSWEAGFHMRTDGWRMFANVYKARNYFRGKIFSADFGAYKHPKQVRQTKDPFGGGLINTSGLKSFVYGKQNSLFVIHGYAGQKFLLAEKAKRHGVMLNFYYQGGVGIGILKPYALQVWTSPADDIYDVVTYDPNVNNRFLNIDYIRGGAGFGKGWKLKFRPSLGVKAGLQFDWSSQEKFIKAVDFGVSADFYFGRVPIMVAEENKFMFINAYVGFALGKKK